MSIEGVVFPDTFNVMRVSVRVSNLEPFCF